jgi:hypothetical protein
MVIFTAPNVSGSKKMYFHQEKNFILYDSNNLCIQENIVKPFSMFHNTMKKVILYILWGVKYYNIIYF